MQGENYVRFSGLTASSFNVEARNRNSDNMGSSQIVFNGFQIVQVVPEPSSWGLLLVVRCHVVVCVVVEIPHGTLELGFCIGRGNDGQFHYALISPAFTETHDMLPPRPRLGRLCSLGMKRVAAVLRPSSRRW